MNTLVSFSGPSGVGKNKVMEAILEFLSYVTNPFLSTSCTTRAPRGEELNGVEYHFLSEADFDENIARGRFVEWAMVNSSRYGTPLSPIESALALGQVVVLDMDVQGAAKLRELAKSRDWKLLDFFIAPPDMKTLEQRLTKRGTESPANIAERMKTAKAEMLQSSDFTFTVVNHENRMDECVEEILLVLKKELD